jgi:hypothetical protein
VNPAAITIPYGRSVKVRAFVARCRGADFVDGNARGFEVVLQRTKGWIGYLPFGTDLAGDGGWPGQPIPAPDGYLLEPNQDSPPGIYIRLRRCPFTEPATPQGGIVIGRTWRQEGRLVPTQRHQDLYGYGTEVDDGYLAETRRVPLVQVALDPSSAATPGVARLALVWPGDLEVIQ